MYYVNLYKDAAGAMYCENVHTSYDDALQDVVEIDGLRGHQYVTTLTDSGGAKFKFSDTARAAYIENQESEKQHTASLGRWYADTRL